MTYIFFIRGVLTMLILILLTLNGCILKEDLKQSGYYVHSQGDDNNSGTFTNPFKSIHALSKINIKPGDTIFFEGGSTFPGTLNLSLDGSHDQHIVITSYGNGKAAIDGQDKEACTLRGDNYLVRNLKMKGSGRKSGNAASGLVIEESQRVMIENVTCTGFQKCGLLVQNSSEVTVKNVHALHNGAIGISVRNSRKCEVKDCLAENNPGDPTNLTNHSGNGILVGESQSILIDRCVATNNGWDMPRTGNGPVGIWAYQTDSIIIQHCISYRNKTSEGAKDGGGFDFDGGVTNSIIQYCLSYENEGAGYGLFQYPGADPWSNNIIRYNLSINDGIVTDGAGGIFVWNGGESDFDIRDCYIHNNVLYNERKPAVVFEAASKHVNFNFNNNIFIGSGNIVEGPTSGDVFLGNIWWNCPGSMINFRNYKNLDVWAKKTGQEMLNGTLMGMQVDPKLKGPYKVNISDPYKLEQLLNYQLNDNSPAIDQGIDVNKLHNIETTKDDFFGKKLSKLQTSTAGVHSVNEQED